MGSLSAMISLDLSFSSFFRNVCRMFCKSYEMI